MRHSAVSRDCVGCRANAEACAGLAETTRDPRKKAALLALAKVWLRLADRAESQRASTVQDAIYGGAVHRATAATNRAFDRAVKRAFDIVVATVALILFLPTFLLVSIAIKIDSGGPVFCLRMTRGRNGNVTVLNFRTTEVKSTSNVTRVGFCLRESGIDRLPELINVLRGELSIVGPSPRMPDDFVAEQLVLIQQVHGVKPGIVNWTQVDGRCGESCCEAQRIERGVHYIENWSLLLDIKIILTAVIWRSRPELRRNR